jgi:hypothetical protein
MLFKMTLAKSSHLLRLGDGSDWLEKISAWMISLKMIHPLRLFSAPILNKINMNYTFLSSVNVNFCFVRYSSMYGSSSLAGFRLNFKQYVP